MCVSYLYSSPRSSVMPHDTIPRAHAVHLAYRRCPPRVIVPQVTYDAWQLAIAYCQPGKHYKGIGGIIQAYVEGKGYSTVRNFCGYSFMCSRIGSFVHRPDLMY